MQAGFISVMGFWVGGYGGFDSPPTDRSTIIDGMVLGGNTIVSGFDLSSDTTISGLSLNDGTTISGLQLL